MKKSLRLLAPVIFMAGCSVLTPPSEDPVLIKLGELDQRLAAIERGGTKPEPRQSDATGDGA